MVATTVSTPVITCRATDTTAALASVTMTIDGAAIGVCGPYGTANDANYAGLLGTPSAGSHTYVITATDANGASNTTNGTFTVAGSTNGGPTISGIVVAPTASTPVITCRATDAAALASVTMTIDGASITVCGPYGTQNDANYAGLLGTLTPGSHTYVIKATDVNGKSNSSTSTFTVPGAVNGPLISSVVVAASAATPVITYRVTDTVGITSTTITVDGTPLTLFGPYGTKYAANYSGLLGTLSAGSHTYLITANDAQGLSNTSTGSFTVASQTAVAAALSTTTGDSATVDWLVDSNDAASQSGGSSNAVDAAFASY